MDKEQEKKQDDLDWENRILCIDGNCIGVIGPDGRCKECGKPYIASADQSPSDDVDEEKALNDTAQEADGATSQPAETRCPDGDDGDDQDWENRILCIDGNCIGVIGPDGRCKECGKPFPDKIDKSRLTP